VIENLLVIARSEEIRRCFAESYPLLGYEVSVYEDIYEPIRELNRLDPDHVIMDVDELARKWKIVAAGLKLAQKKITLILFASAMTLEEAHESLILGVSGIIIKPFLPEFHLKRVYDIIHRKLRSGGKRICPRFYAGAEFKGSLSFYEYRAGQNCEFTLINLSELGAAVWVESAEHVPAVQEGYSMDSAILKIDGQEYPVSFHVAFRNEDVVGVAFEQIKKEKSNLQRFLERLSLKAFGISGIKGRW
jgi:DNA-binding response OmpR family regulator